MNKTLKNLLIKLRLLKPDPEPVVIPMPARPVYQPRVFSMTAPPPHIPKRAIPKTQYVPVKRAVNDNTLVRRNDDDDTNILATSMILNSLSNDSSATCRAPIEDNEIKSGNSGDFGGAGAGGSWEDDKYSSGESYSPSSSDSYSSSSSDSYSSSDSSSSSSSD